MYERMERYSKGEWDGFTVVQDVTFLMPLTFPTPPFTSLSPQLLPTSLLFPPLLNNLHFLHGPFDLPSSTHHLLIHSPSSRPPTISSSSHVHLVHSTSRQLTSSSSIHILLIHSPSPHPLNFFSSTYLNLAPLLPPPPRSFTSPTPLPPPYVHSPPLLPLAFLTSPNF